MTYKIGNTIKLEVVFKGWDGSPVDPELVKIIFYNKYYNLIEQHVLGSANRIDTGHYVYYFIPATKEDYIYEWYGEINGQPALNRKPITVRFI